MKNMVISIGGIVLLSFLIYAGDYDHIKKNYGSRLVVVEFAFELESRGEVVRKSGKATGIIYDDSKILIPSIAFEKEDQYRKRLGLLTDIQPSAFSNYKPPKTVKVLYQDKEISGDLLFSDYSKGVSIVKVANNSFPFKPLKFEKNEFKTGESIYILTLLPLKSFNNPLQLIKCNISVELIKDNDRFFQCDKSLTTLTGGLVIKEDLKPAGILTTPESIPTILDSEKDNVLAKYYGLSPIVITPYSQFLSIFGVEKKKETKLWLGLLPQTFSIYYQAKLKDILKDENYKVAINVDKVI
ncbi:MAG: hypothetical protein ACK4NF_07135, partial [Planctomycetota bacterium]